MGELVTPDDSFDAPRAGDDGANPHESHFSDCPAHVGGSCTCDARGVGCPFCGDAASEELKRALEQACKDLQQAHNEVLRAQGCDEAKFLDYSWPSWTPQANTIRWAEKLLGKPLGKRGAQS